MTVTCNGAECTIETPEVIASGSSNFFDITFSFDSRWTGLTKTVYFKNGNAYDSVVLSTNVCKLPVGVSALSGDLYIGIVGSIDSGELTVITTPYVFATTILQGITLS